MIARESPAAVVSQIYPKNLTLSLRKCTPMDGWTAKAFVGVRLMQNAGDLASCTNDEKGSLGDSILTKIAISQQGAMKDERNQ